MKEEVKKVEKVKIGFKIIGKFVLLIIGMWWCACLLMFCCLFIPKVIEIADYGLSIVGTAENFWERLFLPIVTEVIKTVPVWYSLTCLIFASYLAFALKGKIFGDDK